MRRAPDSQGILMANTDLSGTVFDERFQVLKSLGEGGMGTVYLAEQLELNRQVAIKILLESAQDAESGARFLREGQVLAKLQHANIVKVYGFAIASNKPYLVMEYLQGRSLRKAIDDGECNWEKSARIMLQICSAMQYAHEENVVHRDLKPSNIILQKDTDNAVKIIDFGLATFSDPGQGMGQRLTATGLLIGSVLYMSPEQCQGKKADHRSDIYSAGCIFYEMLTGNAPFEADNSIGLLHKHATEEAPSVFENGASKEVPADIDLVLRKAMAKDADQRYQSMNALKEHIAFFLDKNSDELPEELRKMSASASKSKQKSLVWIFCTIAVLIVLVFGVVAIKMNRERLEKMKSEGLEVRKQQTRRTRLIYHSKLDQLRATVEKLRAESRVKSAIQHVTNWIDRRSRASYAYNESVSDLVMAKLILTDLYAENLQQDLASQICADTLESLKNEKLAKDSDRAAILIKKLNYDCWYGHKSTLEELAGQMVSLLGKSKTLDTTLRVSLWITAAAAYDGVGEHKKCLNALKQAVKESDGDLLVEAQTAEMSAPVYYRINQPRQAEKAIERAFHIRSNASSYAGAAQLEGMHASAAAQAGLWSVAAEHAKKGLESDTKFTPDGRARALCNHAEWQINAWGAAPRNHGPQKDRKKNKAEWNATLEESAKEFARAAAITGDIKMKRHCLLWQSGALFSEGKTTEAKEAIAKASIPERGEGESDLRGFLANVMWAQGSLYSAFDFYPECVPIYAAAVDLYSGLGLKAQEKRARDDLLAAQKHQKD